MIYEKYETLEEFKLSLDYYKKYFNINKEIKEEIQQ